MAGAVAVGEEVVVVGTGILVPDAEGDGGAEGYVVFQSGEPFYLVFLLTGGASAATVEVGADGVHVKAHVGRTTVYNATYGGSVGLAVGR